VTFKVCDAEVLAEKGFGAIVSFETIEHVLNVAKYLEGVQEALEDTGLFVASTPIAPRSTKHPGNPHHTQEWDFLSFQGLIADHLVIDTIFVQVYPVDFFGSTLDMIAKSLYELKLSDALRLLIRGPSDRLKLHAVGPSSIMLWDSSTHPVKMFEKRVVGYQILV
jgi:hypothetical protein